MNSECSKNYLELYLDPGNGSLRKDYLLTPKNYKLVLRFESRGLKTQLSSQLRDRSRVTCYHAVLTKNTSGRIQSSSSMGDPTT